MNSILKNIRHIGMNKGKSPHYHQVIPLFLIISFSLLILTPGTSAEVISTTMPVGMNVSIDPGNDFFSYINDYWIKEHPVPEKYNFYTAFEEVEETVDSRVKMLVEDAAEDYDATEGSPRQLLGSFYRAALNDEANKETGLTPLEDVFHQIENANHRSEVRNITANLTARGLDPFFVLYIDENPENRDELIATIDTGDFTIRFPPYYVLQGKEALRVQEEMKKYVTSTFMEQGMDAASASEAAETVFRIETRLARGEMNISVSNSTSENQKAGTYQTKDLDILFPGINWDELFSHAGRPDLDEVYIMSPQYLEEVGRILATEPVEDLKTYLMWRILQFAAPYASPEMQDRYYRFYDVDLSQGEMASQKDRIFEVMDLYLGNPIAHLYVDKYFSASDKEKVEEIIANIRDVMHERVQNLSWMDEKTKKTALQKMDLLKEQAGYPEEWAEYKNLTITDGSYLNNMLSLTEYFTNGTLQFSGEPSDPDVWYVSPHGVEAHYDLIHNRIIAPAGFLNPPFFDPEVDDAWNYGSFGWVYGHELIHMIDIGGQKYNPDGKRENWWTDEDANNYIRAAWPLIVQINSTEILPNFTLNGTKTLIETSADLGGITLAYDAYVKSRPNSSNLDVPGYDGFTDRQRFFIAFAQAMRGNITDENLRNVTESEEHPWNKFRVNTIPYHLDAFYKAFPDINPGDDLYLNESERARVW